MVYVGTVLPKQQPLTTSGTPHHHLFSNLCSNNHSDHWPPAHTLHHP